ncbi:MAG: pyridoxamine 5'-phosphate oxidase family protein [Myxococcota bacterium]
MIDPNEWEAVRPLFRTAFRTSLHFALASVDADGAPRVTPIGTVLLAEPGHALYFELFAHGLGARLSADPRVSVLAVDSGRLLWLRALWQVRFPRPPAARLVGRASPERRPPTEGERRRWERRMGPVARLPGARRLWGELPWVRDLWIDRIDRVRIGPLTQASGEAPGRPAPG